MVHEIISPVAIDDLLYEGSLEFTPPSLESSKRELNLARKKFDVEQARPVVTLGQPVWWNLDRLAKKLEVPLNFIQPLEQQNEGIYLLQLACSFRPGRNSQINWARLTAYLRPLKGSDNPIALDIYPREIYEETKINRKIAIGPSLKFSPIEPIKIEGSLGNMITTVEFRRLEPVVIGYGVLESAPCWDYEKHKNYPIRGSKFSYIILQKPLNAKSVRLTLDIAVEVITRGGMLSAKIKEKDTNYLTKIVCDD